MLIKDRPEFGTKPKPLTTLAEDTVASAVAKMSEKNFGSIVVVDADGKLIGLVTERDIMKRLVNQGRDPATTLVKDIMTSELRVAKENDEVVDWLRIMSNERFRRLPVVDDSGRVSAMMTQGDFVSYTWPDLLQQAGDLAKATISSNYQLAIMAVGVFAYVTALILFIAS